MCRQFLVPPQQWGPVLPPPGRSAVVQLCASFCSRCIDLFSTVEQLVPFLLRACSCSGSYGEGTMGVCMHLRSAEEAFVDKALLSSRKQV